MKNLQKLIGFFLIFTSIYSCENNFQNTSQVSNQDSIVEGTGEQDYACFYKKYSDSITKVYPFNVADKIEVLSHLPPLLARGQKDIGDSLMIDDYTLWGIKERITLNKRQEDSLFSILYNFTNKTGVHQRMDCDEPRHTIVFYNKSKPISYIDICIECSQVHYPKQVKLPAFCNEKWKMLENYFKSIGIKSGFIDTISGRIVDFTDSQKIKFDPLIIK